MNDVEKDYDQQKPSFELLNDEKTGNATCCSWTQSDIVCFTAGFDSGKVGVYNTVDKQFNTLKEISKDTITAVADHEFDK